MRLLADYAYSHGLEVEPGFKTKIIRWALVFSPGFKFLDVAPLGNVDTKKDAGRPFFRCPDLSQPELVSGGETRCHFLVEKCEVVALYGKNAGDATVQKKHQYFLKLLDDAGTTMQLLTNLAQQLRSPNTRQEIIDRLAALKASPKHWVTFKVGDDYPVDSDLWHGWWREYRSLIARRRPAGKEPLMRCFVTGELGVPAMTHYKIEKLADVGGLKNGDALVCFDKEAFRSYGLQQSANASMSEEAMSAYRAGLNDLIKENGRNLAGAKFVHWFKQKVKPADDPLCWIEDNDELQELTAQEQARKLLDSIASGERPHLADNHFYALTLSGAGGRVMVRDWLDGEFRELVKNINCWFDDLEITNLSGSRSARPPRIERLITSLLRPRKQSQKYVDWIKPIGTERLDLWRAAVAAGSISRAVLSKLVLLNRAFHITGELEEALRSKNESAPTAALSLLYARMSLMKAYHLRKQKKEENGAMASELRPFLNEEHPSSAYQCGRLMALLAEVQRRALGDVGAGVVQRYFAAASTTPALVLGRLTRTSQFHLNKLSSPWLAKQYENKIAAVWGAIRDTVPPTLSLEEQSLFALGYYHQMASTDLCTGL